MLFGRLFAESKTRYKFMQYNVKMKFEILLKWNVHIFCLVDDLKPFVIVSAGVKMES